MSILKICVRHLPVCWLALSSPVAADVTVELGFSGPTSWSSPDGPVEAEHFCTLTHQTTEPENGIEGWSISLTADNARITAIDIEGTTARDLYDGGFEQNEVTTGDGNEGAVSAVILSFFTLTTLPVNATSTIARLRVTGGPGAATLRYVDDRTGSGQPVPNIVTIDQQSTVPDLLPFAIAAAVPPLQPCSVGIGDKISGAVESAADRDAYSFTALDGTLLTLKLKGSGAVPPGLELLGPSGETINLGGLLAVKKASASFKKLNLPALGAYTLVLNGQSSAEGGYALSLKGKAPKSKLSLKTAFTASAGGPIIEQPFSGLAGATLSATLKGKGVSPEIVELLAPGGSPVAPGGTLFPGAKTAKIKGLVLPATGIYVLRVRATGAEAAAGTLSLTLKQKAARGRALSACAE